MMDTPEAWKTNAKMTAGKIHKHKHRQEGLACRDKYQAAGRSDHSESVTTCETDFRGLARSFDSGEVLFFRVDGFTGLQWSFSGLGMFGISV